ncbi:HD superfamily phosphohydrolase [Candidatus Phytoplasma phoenicium]|uniref:HD superfamily phosphohydrolase n=1 Tax=Candidatus Phytoplasma phoenicium TaxID=198422 RepID=A0A0L0MKZ5_9MOLU|nr:HD superfamily phosphohydrolase [Candidatus Phytoplasma phoenicium]
MSQNYFYFNHNNFNNVPKLKELAKPVVFRDLIYGYIYFEYEFLEKLINTKCMQRLRRIRQLSCVNIVFHGAEHSRFTHSLGVYELARRFLEMNSKDPEVKNIFNPETSKDLKKSKMRNKYLLLTAALLHDIGHGAYSHIFEDIFQTEHDFVSARIILKNTEISDILDEVHDRDFKKDLAYILTPTILEPKKNNKDLQIIRKLISSKLDFDRLDYLVRDAFYTGVIYGYIDTDKLIRSINILTTVDGEQKIYFSASSVTAIENYFINYYHMYKQVYGHAKVLGYTVILKQIFLRIKDLFYEKYCFKFANILQPLKDFLQEKEKLDQTQQHFSDNYIKFYLEIDDFYVNGLIVHLQKEDDIVLKYLCHDFLNRQIWCYQEKKSKKELEKEMEKEIGKELIKYFIFEDKGSLKSYKQDFQKDAIKICEEILIDRKLQKLNEVSPLLKSLIQSEKIANNDNDNKIFFRKKYKNF